VKIKAPHDYGFIGLPV